MSWVKRINGKPYIANTLYTTKAKAQVIAKRLRQEDYSVRVAKYGKGYLVYRSLEPKSYYLTKTQRQRLKK